MLTLFALSAGRRTRSGVLLLSGLLAACLALGACNRDNRSQPALPSASGPIAAQHAPAPGHVFASRAWGFRIDVPDGWAVQRGFKPSYLTNGTWKTFAAPDAQGQPIVSLVMPGSNDVSDAEIRIGASRAANEVAACNQPPAAVRPGSVAIRRIHGIRFTTFAAGDAAMSHHLKVHAYRGVRNGTCYAIDLLVFGTNPQVFDPPARPPFSDARAFAAMDAVAQTLRFTDAADQAAASAATVSR